MGKLLTLPRKMFEFVCFLRILIRLNLFLAELVIYKQLPSLSIFMKNVLLYRHFSERNLLMLLEVVILGSEYYWPIGCQSQNKWYLFDGIEFSVFR